MGAVLAEEEYWAEDCEMIDIQSLSLSSSVIKRDLLRRCVSWLWMVEADIEEEDGILDMATEGKPGVRYSKGVSVFFLLRAFCRRRLFLLDGAAVEADSTDMEEVIVDWVIVGVGKVAVDIPDVRSARRCRLDLGFVSRLWGGRELIDGGRSAIVVLWLDASIS